MSSQGLPVSKLIKVNLTLSPALAQAENFDTLLVMGSSDVIDVSQRIREYTSLTDVASDFGTTAPEYYAASDYFGQSPQPTELFIGRWAETATNGLMNCGPLTTTQQEIANFTAITSGGFDIIIDGGSADTITDLDFSGASNLNAVAAIVTAALTGATCVWNAAFSSFQFQSSTTGAASTVGFMTAPGSGTNVSTLFAGTAVLGATQVGGIVAESPVAAVAILDAMRTYWYGLMFASVDVTDSQHLAVAAYIEAASSPHIYGVTSQEAGAYNPSYTTDIGYQLKAANYNRSFAQYSSTSAYAVASMFGRAFTVDFTENNSTITLAYKTEPGVGPEYLTSAQSAALDAKNYSYYAEFNNNVAIIVNSTMASGIFFDDQFGADWFAADIQNDVFNLLYGTTTKIPQTDDGIHQITTVVEGACEDAVNNGYVAPGTWNSGGFGTLNQGDFLDKGYYVYAPPIASQNSADRSARKSPPIQVAAKLAGAVQSVDVQLNINR